MKREEMLNELKTLPHPITIDLVVFDDGCQFDILTSTEAFTCVVGGAFPINGPFRLSATIHQNLMRMLSLQTSDSLDEVIEDHITNDSIRDTLLNLVFVIGENSAKELLRLNWSAARSFYVFNDMGSQESALFPSLRAAYDYFVDYFAKEGCGLPWENMIDDDLMRWVQGVEVWRDLGAKKLPPREWLGGCHNPGDGFTGRMTFQY